MDTVRLDPCGIQDAADHKEVISEFIESELERIESCFQEKLEDQQTIAISGFGALNLIDFLKFLTLEEFHPMQGYRWLAVKQLVHDCNDENTRLSGWEIINYASKRGYCNG